MQTINDVIDTLLEDATGDVGAKRPDYSPDTTPPTRAYKTDRRSSTTNPEQQYLTPKQAWAKQLGIICGWYQGSNEQKYC